MLASLSSVTNQLDIEKSVIKRFKLNEDPFSKSDFTMLFFDFIRCPFITLKSKYKLIRTVKYCINDDSNASLDKLINEIFNQVKWFMDCDIDLEGFLKKKEWGLTY